MTEGRTKPKSRYGQGFERKLLEHIREQGILLRGETVLVALSGGPDSLTLLTALLHLRDKLEIKLAAAHFDHNLRPDSEKDLEFCRGVAEAMGLPFFAGGTDVRALAQSERLSVEAAARSARYGFLGQTAEREGYPIVATGHNADDQAETVLLRLVRGSGGSGLRAMVGRGFFPSEHYAGLTLVRPLLETSREEILRYCEEESLDFLRDPSNESLEHTRNRIRHEIIPQLEKINPAVKSALSRAARSLARDEKALEDMADEVYGRLRMPNAWPALPRDGLLGHAEAIQLRVLRKAAREVGVLLQAEESEKLLTLVRKGRGHLDISRDVAVDVDKKTIRFSQRGDLSDLAAKRLLRGGCHNVDKQGNGG